MDAHAAYELHDELWRALGTLPQRMRATIVLRYYEDLSEAEIARTLGCSQGTVKSQTSRGLERLRAALAADAYPAAPTPSLEVPAQKGRRLL
jgi:RNA polymerase sigma factor (sigma-70 family)